MDFKYIPTCEECIYRRGEECGGKHEGTPVYWSTDACDEFERRDPLISRREPSEPPDKIYLPISQDMDGTQIVSFWVRGGRVTGKEVEYIRASLVTALIEAARGILNAVTVLCGDEYSCFSTCSLAKECDKDSGNECLWVVRMKAALEGEG